jgi:phenylpropionate dioxygenase-like ring-hydroxylating dioxygenase large terminal subunit
MLLTEPTAATPYLSCCCQVVCAYHGWRFQADGTCSSIPQALDPKAAATACASQRSCATAFPTKEAGGLLWVWPDSSNTAAAEADGERGVRVLGWAATAAGAAAAAAGTPTA